MGWLKCDAASRWCARGRTGEIGQESGRCINNVFIVTVEQPSDQRHTARALESEENRQGDGRGGCQVREERGQHAQLSCIVTAWDEGKLAVEVVEGCLLFKSRRRLGLHEPFAALNWQLWGISLHNAGWAQEVEGRTRTAGRRRW